MPGRRHHNKPNPQLTREERDELTTKLFRGVEEDLAARGVSKSSFNWPLITLVTFVVCGSVCGWSYWYTRYHLPSLGKLVVPAFPGVTVCSTPTEMHMISFADAERGTAPPNVVRPLFGKCDYPADIMPMTMSCVCFNGELDRRTAKYLQFTENANINTATLTLRPNDNTTTKAFISVHPPSVTPLPNMGESPFWIPLHHTETELVVVTGGGIDKIDGSGVRANGTCGKGVQEVRIRWIKEGRWGHLWNQMTDKNVMLGLAGSMIVGGANPAMGAKTFDPRKPWMRAGGMSGGLPGVAQ
eukprot:NODE_252_length_1803_cov_252.817422_g225_i0.p1 GENE.NODE_252_length_1803_cov_252.817422_g225_i0~~NODE_252_length_1803_cov_252.817422_g225_i0.p1  ORF type:complete len:299 (-),score=39.63 NODE_252_length_1803_cov_252.817422_g225_i0:820-1716(-)